MANLRLEPVDFLVNPGPRVRIPRRGFAPPARRPPVVQVALRELPPRCREVFELSRVHGLKYAEIAEALEISQKTVEAQMGKALKLMRVRLAQWLPGYDAS